MAHFSVLVVCPPKTTVDRYWSEVHDLLAPFDQNAGPDESNPRGEWDYWHVGGRWSGYFPIAAGPDDDRDELVHSGDGRADGGPLRCLGIERIRTAHVDEALARWDRVHASFSRPPHELWGHTRQEWERAARARAVQAFAAVLPDGSWCDGHQLGGLARPGDTDPPGHDLFVVRLGEFLDTLSTDTFVAVVDCHG